MARHGTQPANSDAMVRIGPLMALPSILGDLGANPKEIFAEAGFDLTHFENPDVLISFAARGRLLAHCAARTGCPHLGLLIGQQAGLHSLGLVGMLVKYAPDVGTALRNLVQFLELHVRGAVTTLETGGNSAILKYDIYQNGVEASTHIGDGAVGAMFNILRALCGPDWKATEIRFAHRQPHDVQPYSSFLRGSLVFDAGHYAVVFAAKWLNHRLPQADPELRRLLLKEVEALATRFGDDLPGQVRSVLRTALVTGHARSDQIAALLSMHGRTLNRRLAAAGTNFREVVDEVRFEIARQLLQDSRMQVSEIAMTLDYADASAFTRAFRRWSGTTPAQWRENQSPDK